MSPLHLLTLAVAAASTAGALIYAVRLLSRHRHPIGGTVLHQLFNTKKLFDFLTEISRRHTTFRLLGVSTDYIFTVDPSNVEYILKTNFANYGKGELIREKMKDLFGDGIVLVDGEDWRRQRKFASFEFSPKRLKTSSPTIFKHSATKLARKVLQSAKKNETIDIHDLFQRSTMDSIFEILTGVQLDCVSGKNLEGNRFMSAFDKAGSLILCRHAINFWKIMRYFNVGFESQLRENMKVVDDFIYKVINDRKPNTKDGDQDRRDDFLSRLLTLRSKGTSSMEEKFVKDVLLTFVNGGKDTTAVAISWLFYLLCKHPSMQEKISSEVREATRSATGIGDFAEEITEEAMEKMQYLHAAIFESLRLYPAVPFDMKVCFSDDTLPDGFRVRKGDLVGFLPYSMGRMRSLWGDDAEVFRPDRWIHENGQFCPESPFKFTAFQAGPRICMGKEFALRQIKIYAAVLLHSFRFEMSDKDEVVHYKTSLTLQIDGGLHVHAHPY